MKVTEAEFVQGFIRMCDDGYALGFHERNGGNASYRMKPEEVEQVKDQFSYDKEFTDIGTEVPDLAGEYFLVTGSGKYFRNVALAPEKNIAIVEIDSEGKQYRIVWGLVDGGVPTSELPSHLMNHEVKKKATNGLHRVIYHSHVPNVIALTFVLPLDDKVFTREIMGNDDRMPSHLPRWNRSDPLDGSRWKRYRRRIQQINEKIRCESYGHTMESSVPEKTLITHSV